MTDYALPATVRARLANKRDPRKSTGTRLAEKCIRCHEPHALQTLYHGLCNICRAELIDHTDADERERWKLKYRIRY